MDENMNHAMPRARQEKLLVHELTGEVLVYDLKRHKAHSLNRTSALVWKRCDGQSSVTEIARLLEQELGVLADESVIRLALQQLDKAHLLGEASPRIAEKSRVSRRELLRTLGWSAAVALPLVTTILAPTALAQASCLANGALCQNNGQCCSGLCKSSNPKTCS